MKKCVCGKMRFHSHIVLKIILLCSILFQFGCTKLVYTTYYEDEDYTEFVTHPLKLKNNIGKEINLIASRKCDGQILCSAFEIKIEITHEGKFAYLKNKDFIIESKNQKFDFNKRNYKFDFDISKKNKDGTKGLISESWIIYIPINIFEEIINSKEISLVIGEQSILIGREKLESWVVLVNHPRLIEQMDQEQQRVYGESEGIPSTISRQTKIIEKKIKKEAEKETWELIKDSDNIEDIEYFLKNFPESSYSLPAKLKLNQLKRQQ